LIIISLPHLSPRRSQREGEDLEKISSPSKRGRIEEGVSYFSSFWRREVKNYFFISLSRQLDLTFKMALAIFNSS